MQESDETYLGFGNEIDQDDPVKIESPQESEIVENDEIEVPTYIPEVTENQIIRWIESTATTRDLASSMGNAGIEIPGAVAEYSLNSPPDKYMDYIAGEAAYAINETARGALALVRYINEEFPEENAEGRENLAEQEVVPEVTYPDETTQPAPEVNHTADDVEQLLGPVLVDILRQGVYFKEELKLLEEHIREKRKSRRRLSIKAYTDTDEQIAKKIAASIGYKLKAAQYVSNTIREKANE